MDLIRPVALAVFLFTMTAAPGSASPILDQSQPNPVRDIFACTYAATAPPTYTICGQSFTVGITGTLTEVDLYLAFALGTLDGGGLYDISGPTPTLLTASLTTPTFTSEGFFPFLFNYPVSAGDTIAFGIRQGPGDFIQVNGVGFTNPYGGGSALVFSSSSGYSSIDMNDAAFRTFVEPAVPASVPEPATLSLLGFGLGLCARRCRRRRAI